MQYLCVTTDTGLPLEGRRDTVLAYLTKHGYTIRETHYEGDNPVLSLIAICAIADELFNLGD